jgi:hypothetical protein
VIAGAGSRMANGVPPNVGVVGAFIGEVFG